MSDQSQGPGWWLASDGKWYPPQPVAADVPTQPVQPVGPPTQPMAPVGPPQQPGYGAYPGAPGAPGMPPPGMAPPGMPPQGPAPGQPPMPGQSSGGGSKMGLIIGLAALVIVLLGGGLAFALTRSSSDVATLPTTTTASATTTKAAETTTTTTDSTTTSSEDTTTTRKKKNPSTSRLTTTTTGDPSLDSTTVSTDVVSSIPLSGTGDVKTYCATSKKLAVDFPDGKGLDLEAIKLKFVAYDAKHLLDFATIVGAAPTEIQTQVAIFVSALTGAATDPIALTTPEFSKAAKDITAFEKVNC